MNDEERKKFYRERQAKWRKDNPEKAKEASLKYKRGRKERDPEIYKVQSFHHNRKRRAELSDAYLRVQLSRRLGVPYGEVPVELIELYRAVVTLKRLLKNVPKEI